MFGTLVFVIFSPFNAVIYFLNAKSNSSGFDVNSTVISSGSCVTSTIGCSASNFIPLSSSVPCNHNFLDVFLYDILTVIFILCIVLSKYVSLGSIMMAILLVIQIFLFIFYGILGLPETSVVEFDVLVLFLGVLAIFQHRSNIVRLFKGTENKLGQKAEIK